MAEQARMGENVEQRVSVHKLSSDPSLAAGWRSASLPGIQERIYVGNGNLKLVAMFQAEGWLGKMKVVRHGDGDA